MGLFNTIKRTAKETKKPTQVIYGVTDRRRENVFVRANDWLIDHSPVKGKEKGLFFYSLQLLVNSGVEFTRALEILADRSRNLRMKRVISTVVHDMKVGGMSFSRALAKYPKVFNDSEVKMIYSGEVTGKIEETLSSISDQIQKNIDLESRVKGALTYPATVMGAIVIAGGVVLTLVVPQFQTLFAQFGSELPGATKFLIGLSDFLGKNRGWILIFVLLVGGWMLFQNWLKTTAGRMKWDGFILRIPLIKKLIQNINTVRISSNLATLLESGISADQAIQILAEVMPNKVVAQGIFRVKQKVVNGEAISAAFSGDKIFDEILGEVMEIGEQTGDMPKVLKKTAEQYQKEVDSQLKGLTTLLEPVIILIVGGAVVFMALAILSPIFQLQSLFSSV